MAIRYFEVADFYGDSGLPTGEVPEMYPSKTLSLAHIGCKTAAE